MNNSKVRIMRSTFLTSTPLIKIKDKDDGSKYIVGDSPHDQFILGRDGGLHYMNLQCCESTEFGAYQFDIDEPPYDFMDRTFKKVDFLNLMDLDAERLDLKDDKKYLDLRKNIDALFTRAIVDREKEKNEKMWEVIEKHFEEEFGNEL